LQRLLTFAFAGLLAQLVDGALGMAYGVTATSSLLALGTAPAVASATVHLAEVGTTFASGLSHWRFGNVSWRLVALLGVPGAGGAFLGATALSNLDAAAARPVVAGLLLVLGVVVLVRFAFGRRPQPAPESRLRFRSMGPLGAVAGFVDAAGGGGWGPVTTPTLLTFGRLEPRRAIGTASASEFLVALAASAGFLAGLGGAQIDRGLVLALLAGGVIAAPAAAWLVHRLHVEVSGTLVGGIVVLTNARTLLAEAGVRSSDRMLPLLAVGVLAAFLVGRSHRIARRRQAALAVA
jgi:uncharacterized membrane protein YfcA